MQALKASRPATGQGEPTSEFASAGGPRGSNATHRTLELQDDLPRALAIFQIRCDARAVLASNGLLDFQEAVDGLHASAIRDGLISWLGVDAIQQLLADAFVDAVDPWSGISRP